MRDVFSNNDNPDLTHQKSDRLMGEITQQHGTIRVSRPGRVQGRGQAVAPQLVGCSRTDRGVHAEARKTSAEDEDL